MVSLSTRYSFFKRLLKSRTHIDLHHTEPVPSLGNARILWYSAARTSSRKLRDTTHNVCIWLNAQLGWPLQTWWTGSLIGFHTKR
jgi:hypothetical protein